MLPAAAVNEIADEVASVVAIAPDRVRLPDNVSTLILPLAVTAPSVMAFWSTRPMSLPALTDTVLLKSLLVLVAVMFWPLALRVVAPVTCTGPAK